MEAMFRTNLELYAMIEKLFLESNSKCKVRIEKKRGREREKRMIKKTKNSDNIDMKNEEVTG
jgi:hypothetical protein